MKEDFSMEKKIEKLLRGVEKDSDFYDALISIAKKVSKPQKNLIVDVFEMESIIDPDKVEPEVGLDRMEVDI